MRNILVGIGLLFGILCMLVLRPVPILNEEECEGVIAKLENLHEGPEHDLVIKLVEDSRRYYINRALAEELKSML